MVSALPDTSLSLRKWSQKNASPKADIRSTLMRDYPTSSHFYVERYPVPPTEGVDPLACPDQGDYSERPIGDGKSASGAVRLRIGYAAQWNKNRAGTWSGSAWRLQEALRTEADVVDLGVEFDPVTLLALRSMAVRYRAGQLVNPWPSAPATNAYVTRTLRRRIRENSKDSHYHATITIDSIAHLPEPFFVYYDSSWDLAISAAPDADLFARQRGFSPRGLARVRDFQVSVYQGATGVIVESRWMARCLVEQSGVSPSKIHVSPPGIVAGRDVSATPLDPLPYRERPRRKLLFVGRMHAPWDFLRKGGDLVVKALAILRSNYDPGITLTVAGMEEWPLPGGIPDGVDFRGIISPYEVERLLDSHDLFVMPSRMEPFGLVFAEAMARGMPCVARNACAMPEIITPGVSGYLIDNDDVQQLAKVIAEALDNDDLYTQTRARATRIAEYFSWERTARDVLNVVRKASGANL